VTNSTGVEADPSVCYRHPGRQSWVLCQRCGRTICPECQILAPVGVHCPECVAETSGGVQWRPTNAAPAKVSPIRRSRRATRTRSLLTGGSGVDATRVILGVVVVLWLVGFLTIGVSSLGAGLPLEWLAAVPGDQVQIWRFVTAPFAYPSAVSVSVILGFVLNVVFFYLSGPQLERMLGRRRFLGTLLVSAVVGISAAYLSGQVGYGLIAPLFGLFAALLVVEWQSPQVRTQILIMLGINLLLVLVLSGGYGLPELVGGLIGGAGMTYVFRIAPDRGWKPRTPTLLVGGASVLIAVIAIVSGVLTS
jgi:membrane associated rhomboid family serine protease